MTARVSSDAERVRIKRVHKSKGITMHPEVQAKLTELAKEMCTSESGCISQLVLRAWRESQPGYPKIND